MPIELAGLIELARQWGIPVALAIGFAVWFVWLVTVPRKAADGTRLSPRFVPGTQLDSVHGQQARELLNCHQQIAEWRGMYERADEERKFNGRELAQQLQTLGIALQLLQRRNGST